jgi:hypothetical protein
MARAPRAATIPPTINATGNMNGAKAEGRREGPKSLSLTNRTTVKTEAPYAPRAMNPGWEQENSPM